jgi:hypothetical protein
MDDQAGILKESSSIMVLPAFGKSPELKLDLSNVREAERRLIEAKTVNPVTYIDLENCFNQSYRDLRRFTSLIGYEIVKAQKAVSDSKADVILGEYATVIADNPKKGNSDLRDAYLARDVNYSAALDRVGQLQAMESYFDGKIKTMENVSRYLKKQMDLILRSGLSGADLYVTSGKR